jgi:hypothetical protein
MDDFDSPARPRAVYAQHSWGSYVGLIFSMIKFPDNMLHQMGLFCGRLLSESATSIDFSSRTITRSTTTTKSKKQQVIPEKDSLMLRPHPP